MTAIRKAIPTDARAIAEIHVDAWRAAYQGLLPVEFLSSLSVERREETWRKDLENETTAIWVAEDTSAVVGWISLGESRDRDASDRTGELWAMYIHPRNWRRGIGRALWDSAEEHLRRSGRDEVTLWVLKDNTQALAFYGAVGFTVEVGREKSIELGGIHLAEIRLRRRLSSTSR